MFTTNHRIYHCVTAGLVAGARVKRGGDFKHGRSIHHFLKTSPFLFHGNHLCLHFLFGQRQFFTGGFKDGNGFFFVAMFVRQMFLDPDQIGGRDGEIVLFLLVFFQRGTAECFYFSQGRQCSSHFTVCIGTLINFQTMFTVQYSLVDHVLHVLAFFAHGGVHPLHAFGNQTIQFFHPCMNVGNGLIDQCQRFICTGQHVQIRRDAHAHGISVILQRHPCLFFKHGFIVPIATPTDKCIAGIGFQKICLTHRSVIGKFFRRQLFRFVLFNGSRRHVRRVTGIVEGHGVDGVHGRNVGQNVHQFLLHPQPFGVVLFGLIQRNGTVLRCFTFHRSGNVFTDGRVFAGRGHRQIHPFHTQLDVFLVAQHSFFCFSYNVFRPIAQTQQTVDVRRRSEMKTFDIGSGHHKGFTDDMGSMVVLFFRFSVDHIFRVFQRLFHAFTDLDTNGCRT